MIFESNQDFYQLLEIDQTASPHEIKAAYLKIKSAYRKDNLALYSMMDSSECDSILEKIEEAYATLSNLDARKDYDTKKHFEAPMRVDASHSNAALNDIVSIDRVPPMESSDETDLLNPPVTDFMGSNPVPTMEPAPIVQAGANATHQTSSSEEWSGIILRKTRESKRLSLDEVSSLTRISKTYLQAIEDETFDKLPAPVFVRGFIIQYAKILKLQPELVAATYMTRFKKTG
jgi:curved DNA-binding protein CbpA